MKIRSTLLSMQFALLVLVLALGCARKTGSKGFVPFELPSALTKAYIEAKYRPQIARLREIATHPQRYTDERNQRSVERQRLAYQQGGNAAQQVILMSKGTPIDGDSRLFSDPSIINASVTVFSRESGEDVGGPYGFSSEPNAPDIVSVVPFAKNPFKKSELFVLPAWVEFSDGSRRRAVVYDGGVTADVGEERRFQLVLDLKTVVRKMVEP